MPDKAAYKMAGRTILQRSRVPTLRYNYTGLVAILGTEGALEGILKSYGVLLSPCATTSGALATRVDILGAGGVAATILKSPGVLLSPAN